jgi:hypothetical protein
VILDPTKIARYVNKANIVTAAWRVLFDAVPTKHAVILAMAVAEFETHLGDAGGSWMGEHNWGAVHKRSLTHGEAATLSAHSIAPTGGDVAVASARALVVPTAADEALHIDDSPNGKYFVWFWAFPNHVEAAKKYLTTLIANRPGVRSVIDGGTADDVARAMYRSKYFSGVHKGDDEANIGDYAKNVATKALAIESALSMAGWDPARAGEPQEDPSTVSVLANLAEQKAVDVSRATHGAVPVILFGLVLGGVGFGLMQLVRGRASNPSTEAA